MSEGFERELRATAFFVVCRFIAARVRAGLGLICVCGLTADWGETSRLGFFGELQFFVECIENFLGLSPRLRNAVQGEVIFA